MITICIISAIAFVTTKAKYRNTESIKLVEGTVNYKVPDLRVVAVKISEDGTKYTDVGDVPTSGYTLNIEKSMCKVVTETSGIENAPKDNNITIEYVDGKINFKGISKNNTRCYLYLDKKDEEKPVITNVTTSVTKTEITVNVTATDDKGVTEYWYQIDSNAVVQGTGATHKFTGLVAGSTHTIKVYVKDAAGNQSDTTTKSVTTSSPTASEIILGNITLKTTTPDFRKAATTNEGVYSASDGMYGGTSYYWRGAVTNNYVKFANKCWRIIRINGDKSIRLIYDGTSCHANGQSTTESLAVTSQSYNSSYDRSEYVGYTYSEDLQRTTGGTASNLKSGTDTWYNNNIGNNTTYSSKVASGKYCNERNVASGYSWASQTSKSFYYVGYTKSGAGGTTPEPTLGCSSGDVYTLKAGTITMDEVVMAGSGKYATTNSNYYLYNGQYYWTMSPSGWNSNRANAFIVDSSGQLAFISVQSTHGIRPVINIKSDVTFSGGTGTQSNPYVVQ